MKKSIIRILSTLLSVVILIAAVPIFQSSAQNAEASVWSGKIASGFAGGSGTSEDPYIIETAEQLAFFAASQSTFEGEYIKLINDIYLNDTADFASWETDAPANEWTPIKSGFNGSFDGGNHTVYGLYINGSSNGVGLFSRVSYGTIKGINIKDSYLKGKYNVGGIVGSAYYSVITNCRNEANVSGENYVGGITGYLFKSEISCCSNSGDISGNNNIGGITGYLYSVTESIESYVSPFFSVGLIADCYNSGSIEGSDNVGGICGELYQEGFYWDINYGDYVSCFTPCIERVYNIGEVKPDWGKIVDYADNGHSSTVYYIDGYFLQKDLSKYETGIGNLGNNSSHYMESKCIGISAEDALKQETYKTFDFENTWVIDNSGDYPYPMLRENAVSHKHEFIRHNQEKESEYLATLTCYCGRSHSAVDFSAVHYIDEWDRITEPTCTQDGEKYYYCDVCGYTKTQTLKATGHTEVVDNAVDPSCTETGLTQGKHCSTCNEILEAQEAVAATGHSFGEWIVKTPAKPGVEGEEERVCASCGEKETRKISALPVELVGLKLISSPAKTSYAYKSAVDTAGLKVVACYNNGDEIDVTDKALIINFNTKSVGNKTAQLEFEGERTSFKYTVEYTWWQQLIRIILCAVFWY